MKLNYLNMIVLRFLKKLFLPSIVGIFLFILTYGVIPLNPTNDSWIRAWYDESDILQHYAGWIAYRNSDWHIPLGLADNIAYGVGTIISFTDSIPWCAIFFKLFNKILPETFQYFGIYTLLCFILQSIASYKIINLYSNNKLYCLLSSILLTMSPILLERAFRHTALGSQWLLLFSIYLFLKNRCFINKNHKIQEIKNNLYVYMEYLFLLILSIGIHPYFLPGVSLFFVLTVIENIYMCVKTNKKNDKYIYLTLIILLLNFAITYIVGILLGVINSNISSSRDGFGFYSMNLNAIINPTSCGQYTWSNFLKVHPQILGNYDGFNYLGIGNILGIIIVITIFIVINNFNKIALLTLIKRNGLLLTSLLLSSVFALSNVITFNDKVLFTLNLPDYLMQLCGIFRASSRIFYHVYYCIIIGMLVAIWKLLNYSGIKKIALVILTSIITVQYIDLKTCITEKRHAMKNNRYYVCEYEKPELKNILSNTKNIVLEDFNLTFNTYNQLRNFSIEALKYNNKLFYSLANSGDYSISYNLGNSLLNKIIETGESDNIAILTTNINLLKKYEQYAYQMYLIPNTEFIIIYKINNI